MIQILIFPLGPLQTNCYLVGCDETMEAAVIDPAWNGSGIAAAADENGWAISHILLTHAHFDHVAGLAQLKQATNAPIYAHPGTIEMLRNATMSGALFGIRFSPPPPPDEMLKEGQVIMVGKLRLQVLETPGHAPGHVSFYIADYGVIFDGDVLFQDSIGRTDLPGGDQQTLLRTIREKLLTLPNDTKVFSGHGQPTTIGDERENNPFLQHG